MVSFARRMKLGIPETVASYFMGCYLGFVKFAKSLLTSLDCLSPLPVLDAPFPPTRKVIESNSLSSSSTALS